MIGWLAINSITIRVGQALIKAQFRTVRLTISTLHTDLESPKVSKKSLLRQNGLQIIRKCLRLIVRGSPSPILSTF
jgi:hypothetical protein